jgi:hypothetical protein
MEIYIGVGVLVLLGALLVFIGTRPDHFRVERSAEINAPGDIIFSFINDFRQWGQWSPFEKLDPNMKKTFDGPPSGPGAVYSWSGNAKAGIGRITILESRPGELLLMKLEFLKPFVCTNQVTFTFVPTGAGTRVTWSMEGKNNFMAKAFQLFMNMDAMLGKEFAEGLANLTRVVQTPKLRQAAQNA